MTAHPRPQAPPALRQPVGCKNLIDGEPVCTSAEFDVSCAPGSVSVRITR
jgi:hypothetical protein